MVRWVRVERLVKDSEIVGFWRYQTLQYSGCIYIISCALHMQTHTCELVTCLIRTFCWILEVLRRQSHSPCFDWHNWSIFAFWKEFCWACWTKVSCTIVLSKIVCRYMWYMWNHFPRMTPGDNSQCKSIVLKSNATFACTLACWTSSFLSHIRLTQDNMLMQFSCLTDIACDVLAKVVSINTRGNQYSCREQNTVYSTDTRILQCNSAWMAIHGRSQKACVEYENSIEGKIRVLHTFGSS